MNDRNQAIIDEFRANEGVVGGFFKNATLLLLHTKGAKSGEPRLHPMMTMPDGDRLFVIASKGGADTHPAWYHNLDANPDVTVEYGKESFAAKAVIAKEPERSQLYGKMADKFPAFAEYQRKTDRVIPVVILERKS